jgi:hypothetical protein
MEQEEVVGAAAVVAEGFEEENNVEPDPLRQGEGAIEGLPGATYVSRALSPVFAYRLARNVHPLLPPPLTPLVTLHWAYSSTRPLGLPPLGYRRGRWGSSPLDTASQARADPRSSPMEPRVRVRLLSLPSCIWLMIMPS